MFAKRMLGLMFVGALAVGSATAAEIVVKERPPKAVVEVRGHAPGTGTFGCQDIIAGTAAITSGRRDAGIGHPTSTHDGLRRVGCIAGTGTCSSKGTGAKPRVIAHARSQMMLTVWAAAH